MARSGLNRGWRIEEKLYLRVAFGYAFWMPTQLRSKCPKCGAAFRADESLFGKQVRCPKCQATFELKQVQFSPSTPSLDQAPQANETIAPASSETSRSPDLYQPSHNARKSPGLGKLGRFELRELLGQGAFGRVYKAYDPQLDRFVAIKVPSFGPEDKQKLKRFIAEAKAAARLRHPNIVPVFDSGSDQGQLFIATAFIEGQTLAARIELDRPDFRESARWVVALASALDCAHGQGIVHRDVKPANIMLDSEGVPLLMDFGLAHVRESDDKLTLDGSVLGTPAYMAPEQAAGKLDEMGPASDQYSLGVVFYELLTGKQPFSGIAAVVISQVISQDPVRPTTADSTIPGGLEAICLKAMSKDASKRYSTCQELANDLNGWLARESNPDGQSIPELVLKQRNVRPARVSPQSSFLNAKWTRPRQNTAWTVCCVLVCTLLALLVLMSFPSGQIPMETDDPMPNSVTGQLDADGWQTLFDGKSLAGWRGSPKYWGVNNGAITARSAPDRLSSDKTFLIWEGGKPADFELRVKYKIDAGRAGIQYRSALNRSEQISGYWADIDASPESSGEIWEERGRALLAHRGERVTLGTDGKKSPERFGDGAQLQTKIKSSDWNDYRIVARGNHFQHYINDTLMAELFEKERPMRAIASGMIALRFDPRTIASVQFKDIRLMQLPSGNLANEFIGKELLLNPGCEADLINGRISGWQAISGNWTPNKGDYRVSPREGSQFFCSGKSETAELKQDVIIPAATDIATTPALKYEFSGFLQSLRQNPGDTARIVVECRDTNLQVLNSYDSGAIAYFGGWTEIAASRTLPAGTEIIRIRLITQRRGQGTTSNDAWFDKLSLRIASN